MSPVTIKLDKHNTHHAVIKLLKLTRIINNRGNPGKSEIRQIGGSICWNWFHSVGEPDHTLVPSTRHWFGDCQCVSCAQICYGLVRNQFAVDYLVLLPPFHRWSPVSTKWYGAPHSNLMVVDQLWTAIRGWLCNKKIMNDNERIIWSKKWLCPYSQCSETTITTII